MTLVHLEWKALGVMLLTLASTVAVTGRRIEARPQAVAQVPVVSNDPVVQRTIERQLAPARLDPLARVGNLDFRDTPLKEIIDSVARAGGITVRYDSGMTSLETPSSIALANETIADALDAVLKTGGLTFQVLGAKRVFIYPDTPANRERYTESSRVFTIAQADPVVLASELNRALRSPTAVFQPMILTVHDSRVIIVRAVPDVMARVATWITEKDKEP